MHMLYFSLILESTFTKNLLPLLLTVSLCATVATSQQNWYCVENCIEL